MTTTVTVVECVVCGADVELDGTTLQGELIDCDDCGCELEVASVAPFTLREAPQEAEDWGQ
ncbi:lysine biosynthesis protein LysW [Acanthopleuribacter pedis]|uniref:Lysine biosynthesis protein LysW n=1 Tax=Acanthopleuribacter pedis TaxID=442870 RepID=A0A8J7Q6V1_9BACT|nr:lysine biosynthesis protein LysW [Acanthopleuribacter pedis]MBO1321637.1 lysine biosynthesis protein LysW [Acanthopleuribacter pedis]